MEEKQSLSWVRISPIFRLHRRIPSSNSPTPEISLSFSFSFPSSCPCHGYLALAVDMRLPLLRKYSESANNRALAPTQQVLFDSDSSEHSSGIMGFICYQVTALLHRHPQLLPIIIGSEMSAHSCILPFLSCLLFTSFNSTVDANTVWVLCFYSESPRLH